MLFLSIKEIMLLHLKEPWEPEEPLGPPLCDFSLKCPLWDWTLAMSSRAPLTHCRIESTSSCSGAPMYRALAYNNRARPRVSRMGLVGWSNKGRSPSFFPFSAYFPVYLFEIWTISNLNKIRFFNKFKFRILTNFKFEQLWNMNKISNWNKFEKINKFRIWTKKKIWTNFRSEQFSNLIRFQIWTIFESEQISNLNKYKIWTILR
jgi:hypothetical protein